MLVTAIVHHRHSSLLLMLDSWHLLCIKKTCLIPIEFAEEKGMNFSH